MVLDLLLTEQGELSSPPAVVVPAVVAVALWSLGVLWGTVHVARREDLTGNERAWWIAALLFFFPITLPMLWWNLVRPLSDGPVDSTQSPPSLASAQGPRKSATAPLGKALVYWVVGVPAVVMAAFVFLLILHALGVIHLSDT